MKHKTFISLSFLLAIILFACSKDNSSESQIAAPPEEQAIANNSANNSGSTQISGIGYFATANECDYENLGAAFAIKMTGDFIGCLYVYVDDYGCSPSGTYREEGREYFVGTYKGQAGTFWTTYKFEAKYEGCDESGGFLGAEIFGRCQHPITAGSGTGVFAGVTGRIDFKDDIEAENLPYRGHLQW